MILFGCGNREADEAYKHLQKARDYLETRFPNPDYSPEKALREYELAYGITSKEFWPEDYYEMARLYWEVRKDRRKSEEFLRKQKETEEKEKKTGNKRMGFMVMRGRYK